MQWFCLAYYHPAIFLANNAQTLHCKNSPWIYKEQEKEEGCKIRMLCLQLVLTFCPLWQYRFDVIFKYKQGKVIDAISFLWCDLFRLNSVDRWITLLPASMITAVSAFIFKSNLHLTKWKMKATLLKVHHQHQLAE